MITDASVGAPETPVMPEIMTLPVAPAAAVCRRVSVVPLPLARPRPPVSVPLDVRMLAPPVKFMALPPGPEPPAIVPLLTIVRFEPEMPAPPRPCEPGRHGRELLSEGL